MTCRYEEGVHVEWLVTGDPGPDHPPYRHVFTDEGLLRELLAMDGFSEFVSNIEVVRRTVTVGAWTPDVGPPL